MDYCTPFTFVVQGQSSSEELELLQAKEVAVRQVALELTERLLQLKIEAEVTAVLGTLRSARTSKQIECWCRRCATRTQSRFHRNGHYKRGLTVREGKITLRMPLIRCDCKGYVQFPLKTIQPRVRSWLDVTVDTVRSYLAGMSYRLTAERASTQAAVSISHVEAWRTVQGAGAQAAASRDLGLSPRVVVLDELYVELAGEKAVFLLAVADSGEILRIWGPTERTVKAWLAFLDWLTDHGIGPAAGLRGVVADGDTAIREAVAMAWPGVVVQECVWHVLRRVEEAVIAEAGPGSERVGTVVAEAAKVLMPPERPRTTADTPNPEAMTVACRRLAQFVQTHKGKPWAAIMTRAFHDATTYLREPCVTCTNGVAERTIKELRRRIKTMDGFKSTDGSVNFLALWVPWQNMRLKHGRRMASLRRPRKPNLKVQRSYPKLA